MGKFKDELLMHNRSLETYQDINSNSQSERDENTREDAFDEINDDFVNANENIYDTSEDNAKNDNAATEVDSAKAKTERLHIKYCSKFGVDYEKLPKNIRQFFWTLQDFNKSAIRLYMKDELAEILKTNALKEFFTPQQNHDDNQAIKISTNSLTLVKREMFRKRLWDISDYLPGDIKAFAEAEETDIRLENIKTLLETIDDSCIQYIDLNWYVANHASEEQAIKDILSARRLSCFNALMENITIDGIPALKWFLSANDRHKKIQHMQCLINTRLSVDAVADLMYNHIDGDFDLLNELKFFTNQTNRLEQKLKDIINRKTIANTSSVEQLSIDLATTHQSEDNNNNNSENLDSTKITKQINGNLAKIFNLLKQRNVSVNLCESFEKLKTNKKFITSLTDMDNTAEFSISLSSQEIDIVKDNIFALQNFCKKKTELKELRKALEEFNNNFRIMSLVVQKIHQKKAEADRANANTTRTLNTEPENREVRLERNQSTKRKRTVAVNTDKRTHSAPIEIIAEPEESTANKRSHAAPIEIAQSEASTADKRSQSAPKEANTVPAIATINMVTIPAPTPKETIAISPVIDEVVTSVNHETVAVNTNPTTVATINPVFAVPVVNTNTTTVATINADLTVGSVAIQNREAIENRREAQNTADENLNALSQLWRLIGTDNAINAIIAMFTQQNLAVALHSDPAIQSFHKFLIPRNRQAGLTLFQRMKILEAYSIDLKGLSREDIANGLNNFGRKTAKLVEAALELSSTAQTITQLRTNAPPRATSMNYQQPTISTLPNTQIINNYAQPCISTSLPNAQISAGNQNSRTNYPADPGLWGAPSSNQYRNAPSNVAVVTPQASQQVGENLEELVEWIMFDNDNLGSSSMHHK